MYIIIILILIFLIIMWEQNNKIKKLHIKIKNEFGKKPVMKKYNWEKVNYHWDEYTELIPADEKIDDVTWNDLEMNNVFHRINNCQSYVGEQILYSTLHCLPKDSIYSDILEKKVLFFRKNKKDKEEIQILLYGLGKKDDCYYLPKFMNNLDSYKISGIWGYRVMQILLILSILPAIIIQNPRLLFITGVIFIINLVIYLIGKKKI